MLHRHLSAIEKLAAPLQHALRESLGSTIRSAIFTPAQISALTAHCAMTEQQLAIALLPLAASYSCSPISQFSVGAICHGVSGHWYLGANMEIVGSTLAQTVHAEQSAIAHAFSQGETGITSLTINYSPCGHCRQFINEITAAEQITIALPHQPIKRLAAYLPESFGPQDLHNPSPFMSHPSHPFPLEGDKIHQAAIVAASRSYAPYSHAYSGVAIKTHDHGLYCGSYIENAAYNPSLGPLQAAMNMLNLNNVPIQQIESVVLAEVTGCQVTQQGAVQQYLAYQGIERFDYIPLSPSQ